MDSRTLVVFLGVLGSCVLQVSSVSVWEDVTLSRQEKIALEKFSAVVNNTLPHDWMMKDIYLIKWLRIKDLNLPEAEKALRQHLKWRKDMRIDTIHEEDFGLIPFEFPYTTTGADYEGRPIIALNAADWDVRRIILAGRQDEALRWALRSYEIASRRIRELQSQGQNVTQFYMLCNFDGFNIVQHVCPECISLFVNLLVGYETNYPGMADKIIAIKTPATFQIVLQALQRVMSQQTRDAIRIWGPNKNEWKTNLLKYVSEDELDPEFGGTREPEFRR